MLRAFLRRLFQIEPPPPRDPWAATTEALTRLFPISRICLCCRAELAGHSYAFLSEAGNKDDMLNLAAALDARQWQTVATIQSFEPTKDAFCAKAVRCSTSTGWVLLYLDPYELYASDQLLQTHFLSPAEWSSLTSAFPNLEWRNFP